MLHATREAWNVHSKLEFCFKALVAGTNTMSKAAKTHPLLADPDFLTFEVDRLIHSAEGRLEHQRIHVDELSGHEAERFTAKRTLKLMQATLERLLALKAQWGPKRGA